MKTELLYSDNLVQITEKEIVFEHYYYPSGKRKVVRLSDIKRITIKPPTLWNGKWRFQGTGNIKTWFPKDFKRHTRDRIFFAILSNQWVNIGFTVENGDLVEKILREKNLIKTE
jgi:hypothetical protein